MPKQISARHPAPTNPLSAPWLALVAVLAIGAVASVPASAQLVNGNFENSPQSGHPLVASPNYIDPPTNSWKVVYGDINVGDSPAGTPCQTIGSNIHCVDLNGSTPGRIEQVVHGTNAGDQCTVTFAMSHHISLKTATLKAFANNIPSSPATFTHSAPVSATNGQWQPESFSFTATGPATTLAFETAMPGAAGPQVDNVAMQCVGGGVTPTTTTDPCCTPWNKDRLKDMMFYQGSGSISAPYTLKFQPTAPFNAQMQAYINYLASVNSAFNAITIDFSLHNQGTGTLPNTVLGAPIGAPGTASWFVPGSGTPALVPAGFFTGFPMIVGTWYAVHTDIHLKKGQVFFSDKCAINDIFVRIQVMSALAAPTPGAHSGQVLEFSDGKKVIKTVPLN